MKRLDANIQRFVQYGVASDLADRASKAGLTVSKIRSLNLDDLQTKFGLRKVEAQILKQAVVRQPIEPDVLQDLLERSNYRCNVCKGANTAFIVHHIEPYEKTQDNSYVNLIVLCPNDHDKAHMSGLSSGLSAHELHVLKHKWEQQVKHANAQAAAGRVDIEDGAIDYINVRRIEELILQLFKKVPPTATKDGLQRQGILNGSGLFDMKFVRENVSNGKYLFDFLAAGETQHYHALLRLIATKTQFEDLSQAVDKGKKATKALEGKYAFFIGGVYSSGLPFPVQPDTPPVPMYYKHGKIRVEWRLDPDFVMSSSAIARLGRKNRYIIYCLVRTVDNDRASGIMNVDASPLLIAQPAVYADRTPIIAYERQNVDEYIDDLDFVPADDGSQPLDDADVDN